VPREERALRGKRPRREERAPRGERSPAPVTARRRRGLLLLCVALASGGLAASEVSRREHRAAEELGPSVDVLLAARGIGAGARVTRDVLRVRRIPVRFAPPDALTSAQGLVGARTAAPVPAGGYLTAAVFAEGARRGVGAARRGERTVTVGVDGGGGVAELTPGTSVDVLVSTETGAAGGRTTIPIAGAELLRVVEAASDPSSGPTALATLRVSLRQAIYLTAADNFAREIRLLARPPNDRSRAGMTVASGQL
jgi:pilus assembly protein CpaB